MKTIRLDEFKHVKSSMPGMSALNLRAWCGGEVFQVEHTLYEHETSYVRRVKEAMFVDIMCHIYEKEIKGT